VVPLPNPATMSRADIEAADDAAAGLDPAARLLRAIEAALDEEPDVRPAMRAMQLRGEKVALGHRGPLSGTHLLDGVTSGEILPGEGVADALHRLVHRMRTNGPAETASTDDDAGDARAVADVEDMVMHVLAGVDIEDDDRIGRIHAALEDLFRVEVGVRAAPGSDDRVQFMVGAQVKAGRRRIADALEHIMRNEEPEFLECAGLGPDGMYTVEIDRGEGRARIGVMA
jgi:hypothetical protein